MIGGLDECPAYSTRRRRSDRYRLYIAAENPRAADRQLDRIERRAQLLATQPLSGVARDDLGNDLREVLIGNYLMFYRVDGDGILILRVLHGRRDLTRENITA